MHNLQGTEGGLYLLQFTTLQTKQTFLDPEISKKELGYQFSDLDEAFRETVKACV